MQTITATTHTNHVPVLRDELVEALGDLQGKRFIDGTVGDGGHAQALLEASGPLGVLLGIDLDNVALGNATDRLARFGARARLVQGSYAMMGHIARAQGFSPADIVVLDLGIRSFHVDASGKGFSFQKDEPLDMRFGPTDLTAEHIINFWPPEELARVFSEYGEERMASDIARAIVARRRASPIISTFELVDVVLGVYRARLGSDKHIPWVGGSHPATRIFQALRIAVNDELETVEKGLNEGFDVLAHGGLLAVISFHSIEDKTVKNFMSMKKNKGEALIHTKKPIAPTSDEIAENRRSRSAKLRIIKKI